MTWAAVRLRGRCVGVALLSVTLLLAWTSVAASTIYCKDGRVITGHISSQSKQTVLVQARGGAMTVTIPGDQIERISEEDQQPAVGPGDTQPLTDAATQPSQAVPSVFSSMAALASRARIALNRPAPPNATMTQRGIWFAGLRDEIVTEAQSLLDTRVVVGGAPTSRNEVNGAVAFNLSGVSQSGQATAAERATITALRQHERTHRNEARLLDRETRALARTADQKKAQSDFASQLSQNAGKPRQDDGWRERSRARGTGFYAGIAKENADRAHDVTVQARLAAQSNAKARTVYNHATLVSSAPWAVTHRVGQSLPSVTARIAEVHVFLGDSELTAEWDGSGDWNQPVHVECVVVEEDGQDAAEPDTD